MFYLMRHGQTDYSRSFVKRDHGDISLNSAGKKQARAVAPLVRQLPIQTVCCSPLKRAHETREIVLPAKKYLQWDVIGECTAQIWDEMNLLKERAYHSGSVKLKEFLNNVRCALNQIPKQPASVILVTHAGVHFAICYWLNISNHNWMIDNCGLVQFSCVEKQTTWKARTLYPKTSS